MIDYGQNNTPHPDNYSAVEKAELEQSRASLQLMTDRLSVLESELV